MAATRASDADRDSCLDDIEAAFADGRIDDAERESRTQSALQATTVDQLQALVEDLAPQAFVATRAAAERDAEQTAQQTAQREQAAATRSRARASAGRSAPATAVPPKVLGGILAASVVTASLTISAWIAVASQGDTSASGSSGRVEVPDGRLALHTVAGFERFVDLTRDRFGSTIVDDAAVYPDYASVEIVRADDRRRTERWFFGQGYEGEPNKSTRSADAVDIDLADVDVATMVRAIKRAPAVLGVEDVDSTYVVLSSTSGQPAYGVYVSNEYHETGWYQFTFDGTEIYRSEFE